MLRVSVHDLLTCCDLHAKAGALFGRRVNPLSYFLSIHCFCAACRLRTGPKTGDRQRLDGNGKLGLERE